jgi:hypothetical protein
VESGGDHIDEVVSFGDEYGEDKEGEVKFDLCAIDWEIDSGDCK